MKRYNLDERFEDFAVSIVKLFNVPPKTYAGDYLAKQLIRSGCSAALNFGEFEGAGTDKDKINKLRISLKELRESLRNLNIQKKSQLRNIDDIKPVAIECEELIRITITILKKYA